MTPPPDSTTPPAAPDLPQGAELRAQVMDGRAFDLIEHRLRQDADGPLAAAFIAAFDEPALSLHEAISTPTFEALSGFRFWEVQRFFCAVIPRLTQIDPLDMTLAVERLVRQGGQDGAAGLPYAALRSWFQADVDCPADLVGRVRTGAVQLLAVSLANALVAIGDRALARDLMEDLPTREAGVRALSELPHTTEADRAELVEVLRTHVAGVNDDGLKSLALDGLVQVHNTADVTLEADALALVGELLDGAGDVTLYRAAMLPFAFRKAMSPELVILLLRAFKEIDPDHRGTLDMLDVSLAALSEDARFADAATCFVTAMVAESARRLPLSAFDSWFRALLSGPPEQFHAVLVDWLLRGSAEACEEISRSLTLHDMRGLPLQIDLAKLGLTEAEKLVVCMRGIGWFFLHPVTAVSLAVSALRSAGPDLARELGELIYDPLLVNYGGAAYTYLSGIGEDDPARPLVAPLLARADKYLTELQSTGILPELHPSEHERFLERTRFFAKMSKAMRAAEDKSVFAGLFPRSVLLYGRTAVMSFRTADGQDRYQEIGMHELSASHELPRRDITDPIGLDCQLRMLRATRVKA